MAYPDNPTLDQIKEDPVLSRVYARHLKDEKPTLEQVMSDPVLGPSFGEYATRGYGNKSFTRDGQVLQNEAGYDLYNAMKAVGEFRQMVTSGASVQTLHEKAQQMKNMRPDDDTRMGFHIDPEGHGLNISNSLNAKALENVAILQEVASGRTQEFRDAVTSYREAVANGETGEQLATRAQSLYNTYLKEDAPKKVQMPQKVQDGLTHIASWKPQEGIFTLDDDELAKQFDLADSQAGTHMSREFIGSTFDDMDAQVRSVVKLNDFNGSGSGASIGFTSTDQFNVHTFAQSPQFKAAQTYARALDAGQREICVAFNNKPKNGIQMLKNLCAEHGMNEVEAHEQIASFLHKNSANLDLVSVGDYLSGPDAENQAVLNHYATQLAPKMKGQDYTAALRDFQRNFRLPGEAQKIDRLMEAFGKAYMKQNPKSGIANGDASYILSMQAVMLATDAHNPAIKPKDKMTYDQMKRNLRGLNDGKDFNEEFLKTFYNDLTSEPLTSNYAKVDPSYELAGAKLKSDATMGKLTNQLGKGEFNAREVLGVQFEGAQAKVDTRKPWYGALTGYKSSVTITDKDGNKATVEVNKPGIFSRSQPSVTVKPVPGKPGEEPSLGSLRLAGQVAGEFTTQATSKATYQYQRADMENRVESIKKTGLLPREQPRAPHVDVPKRDQALKGPQQEGPQIDGVEVPDLGAPKEKTSVAQSLGRDRSKSMDSGLKGLEVESLKEGEKNTVGKDLGRGRSQSFTEGTTPTVKSPKVKSM